MDLYSIETNEPSRKHAGTKENEFPEPQKRISRTTVTICVFDLTRTPYGRVLLGFCCVAIWLGQIIGTVVPPSLGPPFWSCQVPDH